jgi:hypothetical protein
VNVTKIKWRQAVPNTPPLEVILTTFEIVSLNVGYGTYRITPSGTRCAR